MSQAAFTVQSAPRNFNALMEETPFKLRLLAQALGGLESEDQKMAWHMLQTKESRATYIFNMLKEWDTANPGQAHAPAGESAPTPGPVPQAPAPAAVANGTHVPVQQPVQFQPPPFQAPNGVVPVMPVAPQTIGPAPVSAAATAAATAAAGDNKPKRTPRNNSAGAAPAPAGDLGEQVIAGLTSLLQQVEGDKGRFAELRKDLTTLLENASDHKASRITLLEEQYTKIGGTLDQMALSMQSSAQIQMWTLMAFLTFMQEQMGASTVDILGAAIQDSSQFQQLVNKALGKE